MLLKVLKNEKYELRHGIKFQLKINLDQQATITGN